MKDNLYFMEIIYIIFYAFLFLFIYYNAVAMMNFSESFEIIVENNPPKCSPDLSKLPTVDITKLKKCSTVGEYYYTIPKANLKFIITDDEGKEGHYNSTCKSYCPPGNWNSSTNTCIGGNQTMFINCIDLLEPKASCTNSSNAVAVEKTSLKPLYAVTVPSSSSC